MAHQDDVLAVRVANQANKEMLAEVRSGEFFTEPHCDGFPAILVRLPAIDVDELAELLIDGWRCQAPRALIKEFERPHDPSARPRQLLPRAGARS